ncbi:MAG: hypothetical protein HLUCCO02_11710 [Idiomarinaceae bacterium HL-53]|nr:MAG: hypothetical protein HLUCCO02_11710 [Idiomarinaceae bacterium HL-53]CUS47533.1 hypothetical protein Ga0003345_0466 [Idiomarinaceae bacterium HL-53]
MKIPWQELDPETLDSLITQFVLQEGTEYGAEDVSLERKILQVREQLKKGTAIVVWSELHETVNIVPADTYVEDSEESP